MIKDIQELNFPGYATLAQATVALQDMGEKTITTQVKIDGEVTPDFSNDWWVVFKGEHYIHPLRLPQASKGDDSVLSRYDLTFQHWAVYQLKRYYFFSAVDLDAGTVVPDQYVVPISLNLGGFCDLLAKVLKYYYDDSITVDLNPAWKYAEETVTVNINHSYIWDVLAKVYELYAVRWEIIRDPATAPDDLGEIHYIIRVGYGAAELTHVFKQGFEGGLLKIERQVQDENIQNIIFGRGGSKNLPLRYFKAADPDNPAFAADPDWVPELANIYFSELRGATFRSYIQGWKAAHIELYRDYYKNHKDEYKEKYGHDYPETDKWTVTEPDGENAYAPWSWRRGYTDTKFNYVEFVADQFTDEKNGYGVLAGSSIAKYGQIVGSLDNNEDIYPTIQGVKVANLGYIDEVVAVEQIDSDDVGEAADSSAKTTQIPISGVTTTIVTDKGTTEILTMRGPSFTVGEGMTADLDLGSLTMKGRFKRIDVSGLVWREEDATEHLVFQKSSVKAWKINDDPTNNGDPDTEMPGAIGLEAGSYYFTVDVTIENTYKKSGIAVLDNNVVTITAGYEHPKLISAETVKQQWSNTFNVWIKNLFNSSFMVGESPEAMAERVWRPILGDRVGNEAKVMFSTGALAVSEDYEFVITEIPAYDPSKTINKKDEDGNVTESYPSFWRLTLAKSDADLESTGLYVPSTRRQGAPGDRILFIGVDMPHQYVVWAEEDLDDYKTDALHKVSDVKPSWVVTPDRVRLGNEGLPGALIDEIKPGCSVVLRDEQLIDGGHEEKLYVQSVTYTYREPTSEDTGLNPDVEIVLSDKYETAANPVTMLQGEVSAISRQLGSISNVEQIVRAVGDKLYLRKDGFPDRSMSPTEFASLLTSLGFRAGIVGGQGWGFFKDENGNWVLETDRINVRQDMQVNNLVINQITARGGMIIESAASMEITRVDDTNDGYVCYFDQKEGTVANLFHLGDVAYCSRFTPENGELKFYKRRVVGIADDSMTLANGRVYYSVGDGQYDKCVNGSGVPEAGDVIAHYGSYTDKERQYVKVRDVIGGGYERYLEGLDSVYADGVEYYFVGRQSGVYNGRPRFYLGDKNGYIEWVDGLDIKGNLSVLSTIGGKKIDEYIVDKIDETGAAYSIDLSNEMAGVACDWEGNPKPQFALPSTVATVYNRGKKDTGWNFDVAFTNCQGTFMVNVADGTCAINIASLDADSDTAKVTVTATKNGYTLSTEMSIYKVRPGADGKSPKVYSIEVSAGSVVKSATGEYTPDAIVATKYVTTVNSVGPTTDKILERQYIFANGSTEANTISADGETAERSIPVKAGCTAILLSLYDTDTGKTLLDRERIPVIADASDMEFGGVNLLRNAEFKSGKYWRLESGIAEIDTTCKLNGHNSVKISANGFTENKFYGARQLPADNADLKIGGGAWVTLSCWAFADNKNSIDVAARLELQCWTGSSSTKSFAVDIIPSSDGTWQRFSVMAQVPDGCDSVLAYIYIVRNGTLWVAEPQLEIGNVLTQWSASPKDFDYLTTALQENTVTNGGLILASLMKLGYTEVDGEYRDMSGISGVYNPNTGARGGLAVWTGGDQLDPALYPSDAERAKAGLRHDGSAFFCDNIIRFEDKQLEIGKNLVADAGGLTLVTESGTGDGVNLEIRDETVGTGNAEVTAIETINPTSSVAVDLKFYADNPPVSTGGLQPVKSSALLIKRQDGSDDTTLVSHNIVSTLPAGSALKFNVSVKIGGNKTLQVPEEYTEVELSTIPTIKCSVFLGDKAYYEQSKSLSIEPDPMNSYWDIIKAEFDVNFRVPLEGLYKIVVTWENPGAVGSSLGDESVGMSCALSGDAYKMYTNRTVLGKDGLISAWGDTVLFANGTMAAMRHGVHGLKVDATGFWFTEDGANWKRWKPTAI